MPNNWLCLTCTFINHEDLYNCEMCGASQGDNGNDAKRARIPASPQLPQQQEQHHRGLGIFRQASGNNPDICWICLDAGSLIGRDVTNIRLACHCAFHYSCLVRHITAELRDKGAFRETTGILCPNAKPAVCTCEYRGNASLYKPHSESPLTRHCRPRWDFIQNGQVRCKLYSCVRR